MQCSAVQCSALQCNAMQCNAMQRDAMLSSVLVHVAAIMFMLAGKHVCFYEVSCMHRRASIHPSSCVCAYHVQSFDIHNICTSLFYACKLTHIHRYVYIYIYIYTHRYAHDLADAYAEVYMRIRSFGEPELGLPCIFYTSCKPQVPQALSPKL